MPRTSTQTKTKKMAAVHKPVELESAELVEIIPKAKKPLEIEDPETVLGIEEKVDEDGAAVGEDGEEAAAEEAVLDDEEVNPFGDKWEE